MLVKKIRRCQTKPMPIISGNRHLVSRNIDPSETLEQHPSCFISRDHLPALASTIGCGDIAVTIDGNDTAPRSAAARTSCASALQESIIDERAP